MADAFISAKDEQYYNLKGVAINDPIIGDNTIQEDGKFLIDFNYSFRGSFGAFG